MLFHFFRFLIYVYFSFANKNFQNPFQNVVYCRIVISMSNLAILKWWNFEYKAKFEKRPLLFRSKIGIFDIFFKRMYEENFEDSETNSN